jgi:phosphoglycolate phosphatase
MLRRDLQPCDAVVFDLDGTLVDTFEDLRGAVNAVRAARGLPPLALDEVRRHVGLGVRALLAGTLPPGGPGDADAARADFLAHYRAHLVDATRPYPGVVRTLDALSGCGLRLAVLSNKPQAATVELLDRLGLSRYLAGGAWGGGRLPAMKPDPAALRGVLDALGVPPGRALMVGDSDVDLATARAAGVRSVLVRTGLWETARLDADRVVDGLAGLLDGEP